jgi:hypothetical protein
MAEAIESAIDEADANGADSARRALPELALRKMKTRNQATEDSVSRDRARVDE